MEQGYDQDRRRTRSRLPSEAARLQLTHVTAAYRMRAMALLDSDGYVWATSGDEEAADRLTVELVKLPYLGVSDTTVGTQIDGVPVLMTRVAVGDSAFWLGAQGDADHNDQALSQAAQGIVRILSVLVQQG